MPSARPQLAAACWLVELGNGDPFLFDLGAGRHERIAAQKIPYDYLDKVFYDGNGVIIRSIPALHTIAVSEHSDATPGFAASSAWLEMQGARVPRAEGYRWARIRATRSP